MRRAVVTGLGFITSIGNGRDEVLRSLRETRTGIEVFDELKRPGVNVKLAGTVKGFAFPEWRSEEWTWPGDVPIPREQLRTMAPNCVYAWLAMREAIGSARLDDSLVSHPRTGAMCASAGSTWLLYHHLDQMVTRDIHRCYPLSMPASIAGSLNMNLTASFRIKGATCGFSTACASSAHAFGAALDHIRLGRQDIVFVAGAEDCNYFSIVPFAGARALTTSDDPRASRAFDRKRDGFVVTGGATVLVLEELEHAKNRGAHIYAEALGWGEASDGFSVMAPEPNGEGLARAMQNAIADSKILPDDVDYINAHGTSTMAGDIAEIRAIKSVFREQKRPRVSSTKSLTGHGLSLAGAMEAGFCTLALEQGFTPVSANITELDPDCEGVPIVTEPTDFAPRIVMTNSSGFGGTNVALVLKKWML